MTPFFASTPGSYSIGITANLSRRIFGCREVALELGPWCIGLRWSEEAPELTWGAVHDSGERIVAFPYDLPDGRHYRAYCEERPEISAWGRSIVEAIDKVRVRRDQVEGDSRGDRP